MSNKVYVVGVGLTKFEKPGRREGWDYPDMARESGTAALADAGITCDQVQQAYVGYCTGDSCSGNRAVYELGLTGLPIFNVNSNCSTGSSALFLAAQAIRGGLADCTLALGFEKMQPGSLSVGAQDRTPPLGRHLEAMAELSEMAVPPTEWMFGAAGLEHNEKYGSTPEHFVQIAEKNHRHSVNNPKAQFQEAYSAEQIRGDKMIYEPAGLTRTQRSPTSDGSGSAIVASEKFVEEHGLGDQAIEIVGQSVVTDLPSTFADRSMISLVGADMSRIAARAAYEQAGIGPEDVDVIELANGVADIRPVLLFLHPERSAVSVPLSTTESPQPAR